MCGVGLRFVRTSAVIGLEAAHVMWFQAGGPDDVTNGLALCALHRAAFDVGAFTVGSGGRVLVSADVCGEGAEEVLVRHHNQPVRPPGRNASPVLFPSVESSAQLPAQWRTIDSQGQTLGSH